MRKLLLGLFICIICIGSFLLSSNIVVYGLNDDMVALESSNETCPMCNTNDEYTKMNASMLNKMKSNMSNIPVSGNVNIDFLMGMIAHHQSAIDMSQSILKSAINPDIIKLANSIISNQTAEITKMENLLSSLKENYVPNSEKDEAYIEDYRETIAKMIKQMEIVPSSKNPEITFLKQMIHHHEGAIAMSKNVLKFSKNPQVKEIATNIITNQSAEIPIMKSLIESLP